MINGDKNFRHAPSGAQQKASKEKHARGIWRDKNLQPDFFKQKNSSFTYIFTAGGPVLFQTEEAYVHNDASRDQTSSAFFFGALETQPAFVPLYRLPGVGPGHSARGAPARVFGNQNTKIYWGAPGYT